jgi:hypothetical protein
MPNILIFVALSALAFTKVVQAQDRGTDEISLTTEAAATEVTRGFLKNEFIGIKPQIGGAVFNDLNDEIAGRFAFGFTVETNLAPAINNSWSSFFGGPVTGLIFTHLGDPASNFFGTNSGTPIGNAGSNMFIIPVNLKIGYNVLEEFRVSIHGGGNVLYRSIADSIFMGDSSSVPGVVWRLFPNVGGEMEVNVARHVAVGIRPDWTITPGNNLFVGTFVVNFLLT